MLLQKLDYLRKRDHWTAEEISRMANIPLGTLNKILTGITKNPALRTMDRLAHVFRVPLHYLLDNTIPIECDLSVFAEHEQLDCISSREMKLAKRYRALDDHAKDTVDILVNQLYTRLGAASQGAEERVLLCCVAPAQGDHGSFADAFLYRSLAAVLSPCTEEADMAVQVSGDALEPIYPRGTILAIKSGEVAHNQLGVFLMNREGFVRKMYCKKGIKKLVAVNVDLRSVVVHEADELRPLGRVLGAIRNYHWL